MNRTWTLSLLCGCTLGAHAQGIIDRYLTDPLTYTTIVDGGDQVSDPRDLDFQPHTNLLWVMNKGGSSGGSMVIVHDAGLPGQTSEYRKDTHSGHFMVQASAMAFSDNGEWAAVSEVQNTASPTSTFMGPGLWLNDLNVFAEVFQNNWVSGLPLGSHIDMLHQSPYAMGIAADSLKVYWVMDGHFGNLCRYDFVQDHGPGYDYHGAGKIWRYTDVPVTRVAGIPSHMVLDRPNGWLYFIDGGSKQIKRLNVNTGAVTGNLTVPPTSNEPLAGYYKVEGATVEIVDTWATQPSGIDHADGRLIVSDHTTGDIKIYDVTGAPVLLGTVSTGMTSIMGVKVGPDGRIWCTHYSADKVVRIDPLPMANDVAIQAIVAPEVIHARSDFFSTDHTVCTGNAGLVVKLANAGSVTLASVQINVSLDGVDAPSYAWSGSLPAGSTTDVTLPALLVSSGAHELNVWTTSPNGVADENTHNDLLEGHFRAIDPVQALPFFEGFTDPTFPPAGWNYVHFNKNNPMSRNGSVGGFGASSGCVKMDNYSGDMDITGQLDHLMMPRVDLSTATVGATLDFSVAYRQYNSSSNDRLMVKASIDCGGTWSTIYDKEGSSLSTTSAGTSAFTPTATQWRTENVDLSSVIGIADVLFMFSTESNFGNNLYIDDVHISDAVGIAGDFDDAFTVVPNPSDGRITLTAMEGADRLSEIQVMSVDGAVVHRSTLTSQAGRLELDLGHLASGSYVLRITGWDGRLHRSQVVIE